MPDELAEPSQFASDAKPRWPLSRVILFAFLAVAVGLLASDWLRGRMPRDRAYDLLAAEMPQEDENPNGAAGRPQHTVSKEFEFFTMDKVHDLLKRAPDTTDEEPAANHIDKTVTETYRYPGAFRSYLLIVVYDRRAHVAAGGPNNLMTSVVRKTD